MQPRPWHFALLALVMILGAVWALQPGGQAAARSMPPAMNPAMPIAANGAALPGNSCASGESWCAYCMRHTDADLCQAYKPAMKTYVNATFGYSVTYPGTWTFKAFPDVTTGGNFYPAGKENDPYSVIVSISANAKAGSQQSVPLAQYVQIAASQEIQGYLKLESSEEITTASGLIGYETTWTVQPSPILGTNPSATSAPSLSLPITYFPLPRDMTKTLQVALADKNYLSDYEMLLTTVKVQPD